MSRLPLMRAGVGKDELERVDASDGDPISATGGADAALDWVGSRGTGRAAPSQTTLHHHGKRLKVASSEEKSSTQLLPSSGPIQSRLLSPNASQTMQATPL